MTGGGVEKHALAVTDRALRRPPRCAGMGAELLPTEGNLLALMLGLFLNDDVESSLIGNIATMAVKVGSFPVRQGLGDTPTAAEVVPPVSRGDHGIGRIANPGDAKFAVITDATFRDGERAYFGTFAPMTDNKVALTVRAAAGTRTITLELAGPDNLNVDGTALLRCVL